MMAAAKTERGMERRKSSKKKKKRTSRTVVDISSSESESDATPKQKQGKPDAGPVEQEEEPSPSTTAPPDPDVAMEDVSDSAAIVPSNPGIASASKQTEDFASIYLRRVTAELADDLDKVREAKDFKSSSLSMLIHALKQGESMYSADEKKRVVSAATS